VVPRAVISRAVTVWAVTAVGADTGSHSPLTSAIVEVNELYTSV